MFKILIFTWGIAWIFMSEFLYGLQGVVYRFFIMQVSIHTLSLSTVYVDCTLQSMHTNNHDGRGATSLLAILTTRFR